MTRASKRGIIHRTMTATLDATRSSTTANTYVADLTEAGTFVTRLTAYASLGVDTTGWLAATTDMQTQALIDAAVGMDGLAFKGDKAYENQARAFPRVGTDRPENENLINDAIKMAQVAEACSMFTAPDALTRDTRAGVVEASTGSVSYRLDPTRANAANKNVSQATLSILQRAGLVRSGVTSVYGGRG